MSGVDRRVTGNKIKNAEGYNRIPQRILVDGANYLVKMYNLVLWNNFLTKKNNNNYVCILNMNGSQNGLSGGCFSIRHPDSPRFGGQCWWGSSGIPSGAVPGRTGSTASKIRN